MSQAIPSLSLFSVPFRRRAGLVATLGMALVGTVLASSEISAGIPNGKVLSVQTERAADLVVVDAGFEAGFLQGINCQVIRAGAYIGEIKLVALRDRVSAGIILGLNKGKSIRPGDQVVAELLKPIL
jgi:hypothetical protein